jgi:hypothetical protein
MADADTAWVMYAADYDTGRQHSRIIPESVRILRTSTREISGDEVQAERDRTGLDNRLHTIQIDVPPEVASENLDAYAERYISLEPGFDFWEDVIGDDIVVDGIAYDGDLYAPDGEGGVRALTEAEQTARKATIRQRDVERETEHTEREAQRRRQAIEYATTSAATGRPSTAPEAGPRDNTAAPPATSADTAGTPTARHVSDLQERSANLRSALLPVVEHPGASPTGHRPDQIRQLKTEQPAGHNREAELELDLALADAPEDVRDAYWQSRDLARDGPELDISP